MDFLRGAVCSSGVVRKVGLSRPVALTSRLFFFVLRVPDCVGAHLVPILAGCVQGAVGSGSFVLLPSWLHPGI